MILIAFPDPLRTAKIQRMSDITKCNANNNNVLTINDY